MSISQIFSVLSVTPCLLAVVDNSKPNVHDRLVPIWGVLSKFLAIVGHFQDPSWARADGDENLKMDRRGCELVKDYMSNISLQVRANRIDTLKNQPMRRNSRRKPRDASLYDKSPLLQSLLHVMDKPNNHRLLELAFNQSFICRGTSFLSELAFERNHQALKRVYELSNNTGITLQVL